MYDLLAVGELNVDIVLNGLKQPPALGMEILAEGYTECMGSSTAICACAAASLGMKTAFFGKLGTDAHGRLVSQTLRRYGVETGGIITGDDYRTGVTVSISTSSDRALVTYFGDTIDCFGAEEVELERLRARHLHVGSYFLQSKLHPGLHALFRQAHEMGMTTSLDAGWDETGGWRTSLGDVLAYTDFFFPNEKEAQAITGCSDMVPAACALAGMGCTAVVKLGGRGSLACRAGGEKVISAGPLQTHVVDTTGAGDSFNAGFLCAFVEGKKLEECLVYGNAAGAVSVTRVGGTAQCPTRREVEEAIRTGVVKA